MSTSVYIAFSATQANRVLKIGANVVASNWADATSIYTIPVGKRMVLKGKMIAEPVVISGNQAVSFTNSGSPAAELTVVVPEGVRLSNGTVGSLVVSGFIEDDV